MNKRGYIEDEKFTEKCENGIRIKGIKLRKFSKVVEDLYEKTVDIWKDVLKSSATSAVVGGVVGGA